MMSKTGKIGGWMLLAAGSVAILGAVPATNPTMSIHAIMDNAFDGDDSLVARAAEGKATEAERKLLLDYARALAAKRAPSADVVDWKTRTEAIVAAAQDLVDGKPGAVEAVKKATDCAACHDIHNP
jgi:hypothetical protein